MRLVIVTGLSGAGKSTAMKMLEDAQYFCVDNLPIQLVGKFVSLMSANQGEDIQNAAIGLDVRSGRYLEGLEEVRKRPVMYIGSVSRKLLNHLIYEFVDNSVDEHLAGF